MELNFDIRNNTNNIIPMNVFGGNIYTNDISNQTSQTTFNLASFAFTNEDTLSVLYRPYGTNNFTNFIAPLPEQSYAGIVAALNTSGLGSFYTYTIGLNQYVQTYNNNYQFVSINVYNAGAGLTLFDAINYTSITSGITYYLRVQTGIQLINMINGTTPFSSPFNPTSAENPVAPPFNTTITLFTSPLEPSPVPLYVKQMPMVNGAIAQDMPSTPISVPANVLTTYVFNSAAGYRYIVQAGNP